MSSPVPSPTVPSPTVPAPPGPPPPASRRVLVALAVAFVLVVISAGVAQLMSEAVRGSSTKEAVIAAAAPYLQLSSNAGDVTLTASPDGAVHVRTDARYGLLAPELTEESTPAGVRLSAACRGFLGSGCQVDYTVAVPAGFAVTVTAGSGQVTAHDLTGRLEVDASSGDVVLSGVGGDVGVRAYGGDVTATGLRAGSVRAETSWGDVTLALAAPARSVLARTDRGDIDVGLPAGRSYRVDAASATGNRRVAVPTDAAADAAVTADTGSGDVSVHPG